MKVVGRLILVAGILIGLSGCGEAQQHNSPQEKGSQPSETQTPRTTDFKKVRQPAVAGMFYPRDKADLLKTVDDDLAGVKPASIEKLRGLVCPHAGYRYSGKTAAIAYKQLVGRDCETVVVMAPSHYAAFQGASIPDADAYQTPLGLVPVSPKAAKLVKTPPFVVNPKCDVSRPGWWRQAPKDLPPFGKDTPHTWEHSLEVQLPFLQRTLKNFSLVPIVFGKVEPEAVAKALSPIIDEKTLLVASSDLSHFHPYETAKKLDTTCVEAIIRLNTDWLEQQEACGKLPILTLMHLAKEKGWKTKLLDYRNSGDTAGDKSNVVGYAAIAFFGDGVAKPQDKTTPEQVTPAEQKFLLDLARKTVDDVVNLRGLPEVDVAKVPKNLIPPGACFVTLTKKGKLRGCIGHIFPREPLYEAVLDNAMSAALRDHRFPSVKKDELDDIEIEVSILTIPKRLEFKSPEELLRKLRPDVDGVILRVGRRQATYLPQVWEHFPKKEAFLDHLAQKAGLSASAWRSPEATVLVYQVQAFKESEK